MSESCSVVSDFLRPHGLYIVHGILQARILEKAFSHLKQTKPTKTDLKDLLTLSKQRNEKILITRNALYIILLEIFI